MIVAASKYNHLFVSRAVPNGRELISI